MMMRQENLAIQVEGFPYDERGQNWGMWALVFSPSMATYWVKFIKLRRKHELLTAIAYTVIVAMGAGYHIHNLIASSTIL